MLFDVLCLKFLYIFWCCKHKWTGLQRWQFSRLLHNLTKRKRSIYWNYLKFLWSLSWVKKNHSRTFVLQRVETSCRTNDGTWCTYCFRSTQLKLYFISSLLFLLLFFYIFFYIFHSFQNVTDDQMTWMLETKRNFLINNVNFRDCFSIKRCASIFFSLSLFLLLTCFLLQSISKKSKK